MQDRGIVRRIDELGRLVIPKELRKTLRIREGDPLEIYASKDDFNKSDVTLNAVSAGTAKLIPALLPEEEYIIVFIPTIFPEESNKGPPEFPGLIAESV